MSTLIGICSRGATSGKDSVADYLVEKYGFVKVNLADAVKEMLYRLNPTIRVEPTQAIDFGIWMPKKLKKVSWFITRVQDVVNEIGWDKAKQIIEVRELLQRTGTECGREMFYEDVWIDIAKSKMKGLDRVVTADIRFPNESTFIHQNQDFDNTFVVEVSKPGVTSLNDHASEVPLPSECYDVQIFNDGTLDDLYAKIDEKIGRYL